MKQSFLFLLFNCSLVLHGFAQANKGDLEKKELNSAILLQDRSLTIPSPFDGEKALLKLFPGKYYDLSDKNYEDKVINWECSSCEVKTYADANEDGDVSFPYKAGVATRLLNVMSYSDSSGTQYKMLAINHSEYDPEGARVGRFTGGLLGLAKFVLTDSVWTLKFFQPAVAAYGAFSSCPKPVLLLIGQGQYAFMIKTINGGAGGPYDGWFYLIAGSGGAYRQVMAASQVERTGVDEATGMSSWSATYKVSPGGKKFFRDIIVTIKGNYNKEEMEELPEEIRPLIKNKKKGNFTVTRVYTYKGSQGYVLQTPAAATIE